MAHAGAGAVVEAYKSWYWNNPLFGEGAGCAALSAPPVARLYHIHGTNVETECAYFYRRPDAAAGKEGLSLDTRVNISPWPGYVCREGIVYETDDSPQPFATAAGGEVLCAAGDGTVPYASLTYCQRWKDDLELHVDELPGVCHRAILSNRVLFEKVIHYVATGTVARASGAALVELLGTRAVSRLSTPSSLPVAGLAEHVL
jgi:hypothetical protein